MYKPGDVITKNTVLHTDFWVYGLIDDGGKVFYIGKSNRPQERLYWHVRSGTKRVREKIRSLKVPRLLVLAGPMSDREACAEERRRIALGKADGTLLNQAD